MITLTVIQKKKNCLFALCFIDCLIFLLIFIEICLIGLSILYDKFKYYLRLKIE